MKKHITLIIISTVLGAFSVASIITFTDPYSAGILTHLFFHVSLFLAILGTTTLIGLTLRQLWGGIYIVNLGHSFRQALFIATLVTSSLLLSRLGLLVWWVEATLILFFVFLEIFLNLKT